jgi:hypothetical protein
LVHLGVYGFYRDKKVVGVFVRFRAPFNGEIWIQSEVGVGGTFTLRFLKKVKLWNDS